MSSPHVPPLHAPRRPSPWDDPLRHPESAGRSTRTRRGALLVLLTLLVPGSAQVVAGNRSLGRLGLKVTLGVWAAAAALALLFLVNKEWLVGLFTNPWTSLALILALAALSLFWAFLFLDTLRLIQFRLLPSGGAKAALGGVLAFLMVLTSGGLAYGAYVMNVSRGAIGSIFASGPSLDPVDGRYNILLMGGDAGGDRLGRRPDSISVISIDAKTGQAASIGIPRNTQNVPFPESSPLRKIYPEGYNCGDECIINSLYTEVTEHHQGLYPGEADPGAQAMMDAASGALGITVQFYVLVDMEGFEQLIDAMGGIHLTNNKSVPIGGGMKPDGVTPQEIDGYIEPGQNIKLDGFHALWYARSREGADDYERMARQRCVQKAMLKQLDPATVLTKFQDIVEAGEEIVETDIPADQLPKFATLALKTKNFPLETMALGPPTFDAMFSTYPDFAEAHAKVRETLTRASADAPKEEPAPEPPAAAEPAPQLPQDVPAENTPEGAQQLAEQQAEQPAGEEMPVCTVD